MELLLTITAGVFFGYILAELILQWFAEDDDDWM